MTGRNFLSFLRMFLFPPFFSFGKFQCMFIPGDISSLRRGCYAKRWLLPDNYNHMGRNNNNNNDNNNNMEWKKRNEKRNNNNKGRIQRKYNFNSNNKESIFGEGWTGWTNMNSTHANTKMTSIE